MGFFICSFFTEFGSVFCLLHQVCLESAFIRLNKNGLFIYFLIEAAFLDKVVCLLCAFLGHLLHHGVCLLVVAELMVIVMLGK